METFKVTLLGDGGVGKTTLIKRHLTGDFDKRYIATLGVDVCPLRFETNYGNICLNIWDCAGQEKFGGLRDGYYVQSHALIAMFDLTSVDTFKNIERWILSYLKTNPNDPIILCGNKYDIKERNVSYEMIQEFIFQRSGIRYFDISAKSNYNFEKPFLEVCRMVMNKDDLIFV